ncbi:hypothetical protein TrRE_jg8823, partial [Triparma retinervis]
GAGSGSVNGSTPSKAKAQSDLTIQNGTNVISVSEAAAPLPLGNSGGSGRGGSQSNAIGKKSLRQMREANRAAAQRTNANAAGVDRGGPPGQQGKKQGDDNIIAGLYIGKAGEVKGKDTSIKIPKATLEDPSTTLPSVGQKKSNGKAGGGGLEIQGKVDEVLEASPVKPKPPTKGSSKKGKGPRAGSRVK